MAIVVAQSWGITGSSTQTQTLTVSGFQTGELLIAIAFGFASSGSPAWNAPAFSDNGVGSVYSNPNRVDSGYVQRNDVVIGDTIVGATPPTSVTCSLTGAAGNDIALVVLRVQGCAPSNYFDNGAADSQALTAAPVTASPGTTNANDLIVAALTHDGGTTSLGAPSGFSQSADAPGNSTNSDATSEPYATCWQVVSSTQSSGYTWTLGGARNAVMIVAGYKAAASSALPEGFQSERTVKQAVKRAAFFMLGDKWERHGKTGLLVPPSLRPERRRVAVPQLVRA